MISRSEKIWGMKPLTIDEELSLPENERRTRDNKVIIISQITSMRQMIDQIENRAKGIPVKDDPKHAELVEEFRKMVTRANVALESAAMYGII